LLFLLGLVPLCGATVSTFDSGADGWTAVTANPAVSGYPAGNSSVPVLWDASGFAKVADVDDLDTYFVAPAAFLGDRLSALNTTFTFDLYAFNEPNYGGTLVVAKGGGITLSYTPPNMTLTQNTWRAQSVLLAPGSNWRVGTNTGAMATAANFATVFGNLTDLWISGENVGGVVETTGLDNVRLETNGGPVSTVPEPHTALLAAAGLVAVAGRFVRRRQPAAPGCRTHRHGPEA
jgi:hypothetical protein